MNATFSSLLQRLNDPATRLSRRWRSSQWRRWTRAWLAELHGLLPLSVRSRWATGPAIQYVDWPLASTVAPAGHTVLVLPASEVMLQALTLPTAATVDLQRVLAFEIDRYTPFSVDEVQFTARVTQRIGDRASVLLVAVARERLAQMIEQCQARGLTLHAIDAQGADGQPLGIDLLPVELRPAPSRSVYIHRWLALSALVMAVTVMLIALDQRQHTVARMEQEVAEQRHQVAALEASRRELTDTQGAASYLARLKIARPTLTALLTELSHCLGDDTWLEQLEVRDSGDVSLSGQSRQASALINRARDCHSLENPHFQGVIQPDSQSGRDRFSLAAQLKQEALDAPISKP